MRIRTDRKTRRRLSSAVVVGAALVATGGLWSFLAPSGVAEGSADQQKLVAEGRALYLQGCSSCHGLSAEGGNQAPSLIGVGAAAVDFQLSSGRMPLAQPGPQAQRKQTAYTADQTAALAAYVGSLAPGPAIPKVDLNDGDLQLGRLLFANNCAQCHNFAGAGGALSGGKSAPNIKHATPLQAAEAIRTGPESMPVFGPGQFDSHALNSIVKYVNYLKTPKDPGGAAIGHVGPVPEGLVIWLVGVGGLLIAALWIGARA